ncbi:MAG: hypothetical protein ACI9BV_001419, partial [Rhodothermales bacterium]
LGEIHGILEDPTIDRNPTTRVVHRFDVSDCEQSGPYQICRVDLGPVDHDLYLRVRGTNTQELEPAEDPRGEDPWSDLWFYSNPVFVSVQ